MKRTARRAARAAANRSSLWGAGALGAAAAALLVRVHRERVAHRAMIGKVTDEMQVLERQARADKDELERSSRELHLSQAHLAGIIDTASAAILTVDADQKIVIANQAATEVFGIAHDDLVGSPLERVLPQRFRADHARAVRQFGEGEGEARSMGMLRDVKALRANGEEFPIDAAISVLRSGGQAWYTVVLQDITERRRSEAILHAAQAELEHSRAELRLLIAAQDRIQEEERKRIARELHDDLQQTLAALRMDASEIGERLAVDPGGVAPLVAEVERLATAAIVSIRRIVNDLRPEMLEDLGLVPALTTLVGQFADRTGTICRMDVSDEVGVAVNDEATLASCLYRVTQEALNNVAKHARASTVQLSLAQLAPSLIRLRISDDGIGMGQATTRAPDSFGLLGMAERVRAMGGRLQIDGNQGGGTTIEVLAPVQRRSDEASASSLDAAPLRPRAPTRAPKDVEAAARGRQADLDQSLQGIIDALDANVAVLDKSGTIQMVNRSWCDFSERNGHAHGRDGWSGIQYLEVCRASAERDPSVRPVLDGISEVLDGQRDGFTCEYPCDMPDGRHWFRMHVASAAGSLVLVNHVDLGRRAGWTVTARPPLPGPPG